MTSTPSTAPHPTDPTDPPDEPADRRPQPSGRPPEPAVRERAEAVLLLDRVLPGRLLSGTVLLGLAGSVLLATTAMGAGGILVTDPLLTGGPLSWIRYGHGRDLATALLYIGVVLVIWAWVRLGREVLGGSAGSRHVLTAGAVWSAPLLLSPPLFTRDVYSYLAQGALALHGLDPYEVGPSKLPPGPIADNVHYVWQTTPAPYGPLFIFIAKAMNWLTGEQAIVGVVGMRLVLLTGLGLLVFAVPRLAEQVGGNRTVALWLVVANPMIVVHLVGGPHNDLLMVGLLATGVLAVLMRRHVAGIALVTVAMAIKATAGLALPFLVWIWARRIPGSPRRGLVRALAASLAVFGVVFTALSALAGVGLGWIPALNAPSLIVNWMSLPTAVGQFAHTLTTLFHDLSPQPFITVFRLIGSAVFLVILVRQWWLARDGGPDVVRRIAIVLFFAALLAPATLPWYFTWGLVLAAALPWRVPALAAAVAGSTWLVLCTYPTGESGLNSLPYQAATVLISIVAAISLVRRDPLRLRAAPPPGTTRPGTAPAPAA